MEAVANKYQPDTSVPLAERVAKLPLEAWEQDFPTIEQCLKDSVRVHALGACFRQNISGRDVVLGKSGEVVPDKAFAVSTFYALAYLHEALHPWAKVFTY